MRTWQVSKLKSTFTDGLLAQINPRTGRVHTRLCMASAATGRLSSVDPNLQAPAPALAPRPLVLLASRRHFARRRGFVPPSSPAAFRSRCRPAPPRRARALTLQREARMRREQSVKM